MVEVKVQFNLETAIKAWGEVEVCCSLSLTSVLDGLSGQRHALASLLPGVTLYLSYRDTAVAQWLRYCATNRKVAGSIPAGVSWFFIDMKSFRSHSASNKNEYEEHFLGVKAAGA